MCMNNSCDRPPLERTGLLVKMVSLSTQVLTYEKIHDNKGPGWQEGIYSSDHSN